jgi:type VI secretion system protein
MDAGLYDILSGRYTGSQGSTGGEERRVASIISNLQVLFNTRRGSLTHLPDFGVPDIADIYRDMPGTIDDMLRAVGESVRQFEPRLDNVRVEHVDTDRFAMRMVLVVSGDIVGGGRVRFQTEFSTADPARVSRKNEP